jgi:hypothetical protein
MCLFACASAGFSGLVMFACASAGFSGLVMFALPINEKIYNHFVSQCIPSFVTSYSRSVYTVDSRTIVPLMLN